MNVRRLIWVTRIPLRTLTNAELRHGPFGWAWRTCGNGGLYSFTGWYYQKPLGAFRAMATRASDAVILRFSDRKPIVITPDDPAGSVAAVEAAAMGKATSPRDAIPLLCRVCQVFVWHEWRALISGLSSSPELISLTLGDSNLQHTKDLLFIWRASTSLRK